MYLNKATLIRFLGNDAIVHNGNNGNFAIFDLATKSFYKDKESGKYVSRTEWYKCIVFGKRGSLPPRSRWARTSWSKASCATPSTRARRPTPRSSPTAFGSPTSRSWTALQRPPRKRTTPMKSHRGRGA